MSTFGKRRVSFGDFLRIGATCCILWIGCGAAMASQREDIDVVSLDARGDEIRIRGQIDFPDHHNGEGPHPLVVMVPGTGLFDRDVSFGTSGTAGDKIFLDMAKHFLDAGIAVARYDLRGVEFGGKPDSALRATVDAQSGVLDFAAIYRFAASHSRVDKDRIVVLAHSEGMLLATKAIQEKLISPSGIIGIGALLESPSSVVRWQTEARVYESMLFMDLNDDDVVTNDEIRSSFRNSPLGVFRDVGQFLSPSGEWRKSELEAVRERWRAVYARTKDDAMKRDPAEPYTVGGVTQASYGWWQQWFSDTTPVSLRLQSFSGEVSLHYGQRDSQTPAYRQLSMLSDLVGPSIAVQVYPGLGHSLGEDPLLGPVAPKAKVRIVEETLRLLSAAASRPIEGQ